MPDPTPIRKKHVPKHTIESVAKELIDGLEDGTINLHQEEPTVMDSAKRAALEAAGYVFEDAEDFLELTEEERQLVDQKLAEERSHARPD